MSIILPTRLDLIKLFPNSVGAEIGVCKGHFSVQILNDALVRKLYCVDAWEGQTPGEPEMTKEMHEANLAETMHHLRGHIPGGRVEIIRGRSTEVARSWSREPLDWAYIDAAHDYDNVMADLLAWSKVLAPGGVLMGHDYTNNAMARQYDFGVIQAVEDFCEREGWELTHLTSEDFASYLLQPKAWRGAEL